MCITDDHWNNLKRFMGSPEWSNEPRFTSADGRYEDSTVIDAHLNEWTSHQDARSLMNELQQNGVATRVVQDSIDLVETDPQLKHNGFFQWVPEAHPAIGKSFVDRLPIHFQATPCDQYDRSRMVGEDNERVLSDWLNMSVADVRKHEASGTLS